MAQKAVCWKSRRAYLAGNQAGSRANDCLDKALTASITRSSGSRSEPARTLRTSRTSLSMETVSS